jgi:ligand-binding sensor domain-containing protein
MHHALKTALYSRIYFLLALYTAFTYSSASAQYRFDNVTSAGGYQLQVCGNIVQDTKGYIWFPAFDGLYRYDGYGVKKFSHKNSDEHSLSFNTVNSLHADADGSVWAGTFGGGLNRLDPSTGYCEIFRFDKNDTTSLAGDRIPVVFRDSKKRFWVSTPGINGLCLFNDSSRNFTRIRLGEAGLSPELMQKCNNVFGIAEDKDGDIYFSTWDGLFILHQNGNVTVHRCDTNHLRDRNNCMGPLHIDNNGIAWIGTWGGGLKKFDKKTGEFNSYFWNKEAGVSYTNNICQGIAEKSNDELWITIVDSRDYGPLAVFNKNTGVFSIIRHKEGDIHSIPDEQGSGAFRDRDGNLWVTTGRKGFSFLDLNFRTVSFQPMPLHFSNDKPGAAVTSFYKDTINHLVFTGTTWSDGIYSMDLHNEKVLPVKDPYASGDESTNILYAGKQIYLTGKIFRTLDPVTRKVDVFEPQPPSPVQELVEDPTGNLWCLSKHDFLFLDSQKHIWKKIPVSLQNMASTFGLHGMAIYQDGSIWTGSDENGIFIIDRNDYTVRNLNKNNSGLPFNTYTCFCPDRNGRMWCGGIGGIVIYDKIAGRDSFLCLSGENGMISDFVKELKMDSSGYLWALTLSGLIRINPHTYHMDNFDYETGIFGNRGLTGFDIGGDGELLVGSEMGYSHFYPEELQPAKHAPPIVITSFKIFDKEYPMKGSEGNSPVNLNYDQDYFSFEFAALTYSHPEKNQYAYRLDGFDRDWVYCGTRRYAAYTNVPGGNYIFHVKAAGADGTWYEQEVAVPLFIATAWWKTKWFYTVIVIFALGFIYIVYEYRIRQLKKIFEIRNKLAADLHDDVGSSLSNIRLLSEMLPDDNGKQGIAGLIRDNARETMEGMYDIIWNLNPANDHIEHLLGRLKEQTIHHTEARNILLLWNLDELKHSIKLPVEKRKDLYLSCKEAIQNVLKYSRCSDLQVKASTDGNKIIIRISDNGSGFTISENTGGNGMINMKTRMEKWKGRCRVETSATGTTVTLELPV